MDQRLEKYLDARFGMFIHWGIYTVAGVEASWPIMTPDLSEAMFRNRTRITQQAYEALPDSFNPIDFNADDWVRSAQEAGMRYMVFTTKHHDGFCMFDAPGTDYKITNTPYKKDICLELAQACARANMPLGFYYSPPDMHHPGYRDTSKPATANWTGEPKRKEWASYLDYMESHIRKLLTDYGDVFLIWFDGLANHGKYDPQRFHTLIHELSPDTLINDRLGDGYDFVTPEQYVPKLGIPARTGKPPAGVDSGGDSFFRTVESMLKVPLARGWIRKQMEKYADGTLELTPVHQEPYPSPERFQPWETCMTMGQTWAYNPTETSWKSPEELLRNLVDVVSRGGNYLLNVGPTSSGVFPTEAVERLQYIGNWMKTYGNTIYGSTYTPLQNLPWGKATRKGNQLFFFVENNTTGTTLSVENFPGTAKSAALFTGEVLDFVQSNQQLKVTLPDQTDDPVVPVLVVEINSAEKGWMDYSQPVITTIPLKKYMQSQATSSAVINFILNGPLAFFSYRLRDAIPFGEASVDILITIAIISFFTSWIVIGSARKELTLRNVSVEKLPFTAIKFPRNAVLRAIVVMGVSVLLIGGIIIGLLSIISPAGINNWVYILLKTAITGLTGALSAFLAIFTAAIDKLKNR